MIFLTNDTYLTKPLHGRTFLRNEDLEIVRSIAFSSMPHDRFEFLKLLIKHEGRLTTANIRAELNCSDDTARRTMELFRILGIVTINNLQVDTTQGGRPMQFVEIKLEFSSILNNTQVLKDKDNTKTQETKGVYDDFSAKDFVKIVKNNKKLDGAHYRNGEEYSKPQNTNGVFEREGVSQ